MPKNDVELVKYLQKAIAEEAKGLPKMVFMEVCGTHTMAIYKNALQQLLPNNIKLISGPGCPVCVTPMNYIDELVAIGKTGAIITTFGDMLRVPGSRISLQQAAAQGVDVRIVYSPLEALEIAEVYADKAVVFAGIGFETTAPLVAVAIVKAKQKALKNFFVLTAHKTMPSALTTLLRDNKTINGLLCPGHVAVVTGSNYFHFVSKELGLAAVITGFEAHDIMQSILMLVKQCKAGITKLENQYSRMVTAEGNTKAMSLMNEVFEPSDGLWRGLGNIKNGSLVIRAKFKAYDAKEKFTVFTGSVQEDENCLCGQILKGLARPADCKLFGDMCTPEHPIGACMVSSEGSCAAHYRYGR
ncbi:MAG: hydrogenase formation protein HypD [Clostridia bacterium]|nr:hydrogenase formation protein HypD [Clostridia bacterium]